MVIRTVSLHKMILYKEARVLRSLNFFRLTKKLEEVFSECFFKEPKMVLQQHWCENQLRLNGKCYKYLNWLISSFLLCIRERQTQRGQHCCMKDKTKMVLSVWRLQPRNARDRCGFLRMFLCEIPLEMEVCGNQICNCSGRVLGCNFCVQTVCVLLKKKRKCLKL